MTPETPPETVSREATPRSVRLQIPSSPEWVRVVRLAVLGVASRMKFSYEDVEDIKLAVSEACNNAILHARSHADSARADTTENEALHDVRIEITPFADRLEICIADGGQVASPETIVSPHATSSKPYEESDLRESGLGLFLMQSLMDEVEHKTGADHNTQVRLTKFVLPS